MASSKPAAMRVSIRRSAATSASAQRRSRTDDPGRLFVYDYDPDKRERKINGREAEAVRRLFADAADGVAIQDIVDNLNKSGILTKMGRSWDRRAVRRMLCNSSYVGRDYYGKTETLRLSDGRRITVRRPRELWIEITEFTPAIICEGLFGRVQDRMGTD